MLGSLHVPIWFRNSANTGDANGGILSPTATSGSRERERDGFYLVGLALCMTLLLYNVVQGLTCANHFQPFLCFHSFLTQPVEYTQPAQPLSAKFGRRLRRFCAFHTPKTRSSLIYGPVI